VYALARGSLHGLLHTLSAVVTLANIPIKRDHGDNGVFVRTDLPYRMGIVRTQDTADTVVAPRYTERRRDHVAVGAIGRDMARRIENNRVILTADSREPPFKELFDVLRLAAFNGVTRRTKRSLQSLIQDPA
jgi:hypothetical protein